LSVQTKLVINTLAEAESSGHFTPDVNGIWNKTMTLQWPAAKSQSRWAVGETMQSEIVSVRYFVRVKVCSIFNSTNITSFLMVSRLLFNHPLGQILWSSVRRKYSLFLRMMRNGGSPSQNIMRCWIWQVKDVVPNPSHRGGNPYILKIYPRRRFRLVPS
jgi:hypothetical protein